MTGDEENLLARLEALNASEPDDATVPDDASMDAVVDGAAGVLECLAVARRLTPQTDAARVGIDGFLNALDPRVDTILTLQRAGKPIPLKASHLRLVLAELDRYERVTNPSTWREPCNAVLAHTNGEITCQLAVADPLPGGRYTGNRNHWEKHWHQDEHGQVRTWTDNESEQP